MASACRHIYGCLKDHNSSLNLPCFVHHQHQYKQGLSEMTSGQDPQPEGSTKHKQLMRISTLNKEPSHFTVKINKDIFYLTIEIYIHPSEKTKFPKH